MLVETSKDRVMVQQIESNSIKLIFMAAKLDVVVKFDSDVEEIFSVQVVDLILGVKVVVWHNYGDFAAKNHQLLS